MRLNRLLVVLLLLAMSVALFACTSTYDKADSDEILSKAIAESFKSPSSYITIKENMTFTLKDTQGNPKKNADGTIATKTELTTKAVVNTYITKDKKYPEGTRLTYISNRKFDEFGQNGSINYWAGTEKNGTTKYLIKSDNGTKDGVKYDNRFRQEIDNLNVFEYSELAMYDNKVLLAPIYNLKPENYEFVEGTKEGKVDYIKIKIKPEYDKFYSELGVLTFRITNGLLTCIQANTEKDMVVIKDVTTSFQIDFLQAGQFINIPDTAQLKALNEDDSDATSFTDNATIVA